MKDNRILNKHLFFLNKQHRMSIISEELRYKIIHEYVMNPTIQDNKRQDLARKLHFLKLHDGVTPNSYELLELAIGVTIS